MNSQRSLYGTSLSKHHTSLSISRLHRSKVLERKHMWIIFSSLEGEVASNMVHNARLNRSLGQEKDKDGQIEISKEIYDKLLSLPPQKGKVDLLALIQDNNRFYITRKGKVVFLLWKSAMITSKRKTSKKYELDWKDYSITPIDLIQSLRFLQISLTPWWHKMKRLKEMNKRIDREKMSCIPQNPKERNGSWINVWWRLIRFKYKIYNKMVV